MTAAANQRAAEPGVDLAGRIRPTSRTVWPWVLVVVGVLAYVWRGKFHYARPGLWAEDGRIFLLGAREDGISAIVEPYNGYLHLLPRLIAFGANFAPLHTIPMIYLLVSSAVYLALISLVLSRRIGWLIQSPLCRAFAFLLLCVSPVLQEPYGNICNLIFVGLCGLILLSLLDDPSTSAGRWLELATVALLGLSGAFALFVLPLFGYRYLRNGRSIHSLRALLIVAGTAAIAAVIALLQERESQPATNLAQVIFLGMARFSGSWTVGSVADHYPPELYNGPFFGIYSHPTAILVYCLVWLAIFGSMTVYFFRMQAVVLWGTLVVLMVSYSVAWGDRLLVGGADRHQMPVVAVLIVMTTAILSRPTPKWGRRLATAALVTSIAVTIVRLLIHPWEVHTDLRKAERCLQTHAECVVKVSPNSTWDITLRP